jgi:hypothetical protein
LHASGRVGGNVAEYNLGMSGGERHKDTRTGRYLRGTSPRHGFDGSTVFPSVPSPPGRHFVPRLTLFWTPKSPYDSGEFCEGVADAPEDLVFFCDTSLFDRKTDPRLWDALLNREGKIVIVPPVRRELEPWLARNGAHPAARAILNGEPSVGVSGVDPDDRRGLAAAEYYIQLLGLRKKLATAKMWKFEEDHGRPPEDGEWRKLMQQLHEDLGPRGYMLAKKGRDAKDPENLLTDETLVYLAMKDSIETGREVVILSKDEDIMEQFYKLQWLMDTHYRAMLLADVYAAEPSRFVTHPMPEDCVDLKGMLEDNDGLLVERPLRLTSGHDAPILPPYCHPVMVHCWIVGEKATSMVFCAEREMERLLLTKAATGGLNTYKFSEKNFHLWLAPLEVPERLRGCAAIVRDRRTRSESGLIEIPLFDANQSVYCGERFIHATEANRVGDDLELPPIG